MPTITGTDSAETLAGTAGDDEISALGGNDSITLGTGHDTVDGGEGTDRLNGNASNFGLAAASRSYTITANKISDSSASLDTTFVNIENIFVTDIAGHDVTLDANGWDGGLTFTVGLGNHALTGGAGSNSFRVQGGKAKGIRA